MEFKCWIILSDGLFLLFYGCFMVIDGARQSNMFKSMKWSYK